MSVKIGVCNFTKKLYGLFNVVEVQKIFYNIPRKTTIKKWREEAPENFEFTFKVFQGLTHDKSSPTWRRFTGKLTATEMNLVGNLRITDVTKRFIDEMVDIAKILDSPVIVVQTPAKFKPSNENFNNAVEFFQVFEERLNRAKVKSYIGWEPRGDWLQMPEKIKSILHATNRVIHVVDPFFSTPVEITEVIYFRLHGKPYLNYKYQYTLQDFTKLRKTINEITEMNAKKIYIMFNNVRMIDDAKRFLEFLASEEK